MRTNNDPANRRERVDYYRRQLDCMRALMGNLQPTTEAEIDRFLRQAEDKTLRDFFEVFFGFREIKENAFRFDYASIAQRARGAAGT